MKRLCKRGQQTMGLPFGMIFAIFLIVVFVVIAFIAVKGFLSVGDTARIGLFYDELQGAVDEAWSGQASEFSFDIDLPGDIEEICFSNLSAVFDNDDLRYREISNYEVYGANTFLIPPGKAHNMQWKVIKHIDIGKITENKNPYCVSAKDSLKIKKDFYDKLVVIE